MTQYCDGGLVASGATSTDAGASCGANFVNAGSGGALDGVTIVEGHEYAETLSDQNPGGGWINFSCDISHAIR